jgi:hypothetical protein
MRVMLLAKPQSEKHAAPARRIRAVTLQQQMTARLIIHRKLD